MPEKIKYNVAIGDVHGCKVQLLHLIDKIDEKVKLSQCRLIFLGDYIDRGPDSIGVLAEIVQLKHKFPQTVALWGNHEDMMMYEYNLWVSNGGDTTINSLKNYYGEDRIGIMNDAWLRFFNDALVTHFETDTHYFVHAGVRPGVPLDQQSRSDQLWIRDYFLGTKTKFPKYIVHGHTPNLDIDIRENRCNLDSGCVFGGKLSAGIFVDSQEKPIDIIQVPGYTTTK